MRIIAAAALLGAAVSCAGPGYTDDPPPPEMIEHEYGTIDAEIPPGELQFMGFCGLDRKALTPWTESYSTASSACGDHESKSPRCRAYVVWRQPLRFEEPEK